MKKTSFSGGTVFPPSFDGVRDVVNSRGAVSRAFFIDIENFGMIVKLAVPLMMPLVAIQFSYYFGARWLGPEVFKYSHYGLFVFSVVLQTLLQAALVYGIHIRLVNEAPPEPLDI